MKKLLVLPLEFTNGVARNPELVAAVQGFCESEFGKKIDPANYTKVWAAVEIEGTEYRVAGLTAIAMALDCPIFHVHAEESEEGRERARDVRDKLMLRASSSIQDQWGVGMEIFVHVAPEKQRFWASFLRLIKAKAANRVIVKV